LGVFGELERPESFMPGSPISSRQKHTFFSPGLDDFSMTQKWQTITRRFYKASRKRFDLELIPRKLLQEVTKDADGVQVYPKLPFDMFVDLMLRAILSVRNKPSTRRLARTSHLPSIQQLTSISGVSHQAIADRLRSVDLPTLQLVFQQVSQAACRLLGWGFRRRGGLRLFDCTTVEVSANAAPWAADNGDKKAIRLALGLNGVDDLPIAVLDASETTSDNTVFPTIVAHLQAGETVIVDAGFTRIRDFQTILVRGAHFVARMANIYEVQVVRVFHNSVKWVFGRFWRNGVPGALFVPGWGSIPTKTHVFLPGPLLPFYEQEMAAPHTALLQSVSQTF